MKKGNSSQKTKKIHQRLNPTALKQSQQHEKRNRKSKNKKDPSKPKPDSLKTKPVT